MKLFKRNQENQLETRLSGCLNDLLSRDLLVNSLNPPQWRTLSPIFTILVVLLCLAGVRDWLQASGLKARRGEWTVSACEPTNSCNTAQNMSFE